MKNTVNLLETHEVDLVDYGITSAEIIDYTLKVEELEQMISDPRQAIVSRKSITKSIVSKMNSISALLKKELDPFVKAMKLSNPKLVGKYISSRETINRAGKRKGKSRPIERDDGFFEV